MQNTPLLTGKRITVLVILAFIAFVLGLFYGHHMQKPLAQRVDATLVSPPHPLAPFQLTNDEGKPFTNQNLQNHWTLLFFGFTHCGNICPTNMAALEQTYTKIQADRQQPPQVVFVSIDPKRDSAKAIKHYVTAFNPNFQGVTGTPAELSKLTGDLGILFMKIQQSDPEMNANYQLDHSGTILLIDPQGRWVAAFAMPHDPANIAHDFETISAYAHS